MIERKKTRQVKVGNVLIGGGAPVSIQSMTTAPALEVDANVRLIEKLEALEMEQWERPARHTLLGPMKLNEVMAIANDHDTIHLAQLRNTLQAL